MRTIRSSVLVLFLAVLAQAAWAAPSYFLHADLVRGAPGAMGAVCVPNAVFHQGEMVVFRTYVYDGETGERLDAAAVEERGVTVTADLDTGASFELHYGSHPPGAEMTDEYWTYGWAIPADHPSGLFTWTVTVSDAAGNEAVFTPIGQDVGLPSLTITPAAAG
ncbi:MAG: hypothetical protein U5J97_12160 [Trueperaceae bacterium]|nr:hypothetical protein [Trueperaceae bacterium]